MSIQLTLIAIDRADLDRQLRDLLGAPPPSVIALQPAVVAQAQEALAKAGVNAPIEQQIGRVSQATSPKTVQEAATQLAAENPVDEPTTSVVEEPAAVTGGDKTWDYQTEIKPAVLKVSQKHGREGVLKLLEPFAVANAQQIPAERHGELMGKIDALLAEG